MRLPGYNWRERNLHIVLYTFSNLIAYLFLNLLVAKHCNYFLVVVSEIVTYCFFDGFGIEKILQHCPHWTKWLRKALYCFTDSHSYFLLDGGILQDIGKFFYKFREPFIYGMKKCIPKRLRQHIIEASPAFYNPVELCIKKIFNPLLNLFAAKQIFDMTL